MSAGSRFFQRPLWRNVSASSSSWWLPAHLGLWAAELVCVLNMPTFTACVCVSDLLLTEGHQSLDVGPTLIPQDLFLTWFHEDPGGLQSMGSQRVGRDWATNTFTSAWRREEESGGKVAQSCPTLCDPMDCSLPGSSVRGILQARILEQGGISFSTGSSRSKDWTLVSRIAGRCFDLWATREAPWSFTSAWPHLNLITLAKTPVSREGHSHGFQLDVNLEEHYPTQHRCGAVPP